MTSPRSHLTPAERAKLKEEQILRERAKREENRRLTARYFLWGGILFAPCTCGVSLLFTLAAVIYPMIFDPEGDF